MNIGNDEQKNSEFLLLLAYEYAKTGDFSPIQNLLSMTADDFLRKQILGFLFWNALGESNESLAIRCLAEGHDIGPNESDPFGPLHPAICDFGDRTDILVWLLDRGADIEHRVFNNWTPLHLAIYSNRPAIFQVLLDRGADSSATTEVDANDSALIMAARLGHASMVKALLDQQVDRLFKNRNRETAAEVARKAGHEEIAEMIESIPKLRSNRRQKKHKRK